MLRETLNTADKNSRWFNDDYFDLIVCLMRTGERAGSISATTFKGSKMH
jgi:hypothetical protein